MMMPNSHSSCPRLRLARFDFCHPIILFHLVPFCDEMKYIAHVQCHSHGAKMNHEKKDNIRNTISGGTANALEPNNSGFSNMHSQVQKHFFKSLMKPLRTL